MPRLPLLLVGALALTPPLAVAQTAVMFGVGKARDHQQTGPTGLTLSAHRFNSFVELPGGDTLAGAWVSGKAGWLLANGPQPVSGVNGFRPADFSTQTGLDADFPSQATASYRVELDLNAPGGALPGGRDLVADLALVGDAYPATVPLFTLNNGGWLGGVFHVDPSQPTSFGWLLPDYNPVTDVVRFSVAPEGGGAEVAFAHFQGGQPGGFTVAAGAFQAGHRYDVSLSFARIVDQPDLGGGIMAVAYFANDTNLTLYAVPEPGTGLLLALGLAGVAWWSWRRRG